MCLSDLLRMLSILLRELNQASKSLLHSEFVAFFPVREEICFAFFPSGMRVFPLVSAFPYVCILPEWSIRDGSRVSGAFVHVRKSIVF